jgi:hypothetical protein
VNAENSLNSSSGNEHLSLDILVDAYYGASDDLTAVRAHLSSCESCTERWNELERKRSTVALPAEISADFLAAQRRKIYQRIDQPLPGRWRVWIPTVAAAAILTAGIFALRPAPETPRSEVSLRPDNAARPEGAPRPEMNDAQLFADVYTLEQSYEPSAAAPIQALFMEERNLGEEQN